MELLTREFYKILQFEYRWRSKRTKYKKVWRTLIQVFSKFIIVRRTEKKDSKRFPKKSYFDVETWIVSRTVQSRVNFNHKLNVIIEWWNYFWYFMLTIKKYSFEKISLILLKNYISNNSRNNNYYQKLKTKNTFLFHTSKCFPIT